MRIVGIYGHLWPSNREILQFRLQIYPRSCGSGFSIVDNVFAVLYFLELTRLGVDRSLACLVMVGSAVRTLSVGTVSWNCQLE